MDFVETNPFETDHFTPETQDKEIGLFNPSQPSGDFPAGGDGPPFPMDFLETQVMPPLPGIIYDLEESDNSDSCPASPSPLSSPSLDCRSSSSESGIEDVSDMEDTPSVYSQIIGGNAVMKKGNPPSPLNSLTQASEITNGGKKRRKSSRKTSNDSSVLDELNKLLAATSTSVDHSGFQPSQAITGHDVMVGIQTTASPTSVSNSCPLSVEGGQATTLAQALSISSSSNQMMSSASVTKVSSSPSAASLSKTRSKPSRNTKKSDEPKIVIVEEPEENYRARYESEGCRGPIHGSQENSFPAVKVTGYTGAVWITVHLTTSGGVPHYHSIHGPGSTKVPCKETTLPGGVPAVQVMVAPDSNMTAVLDSLSIRRLRNWEGDRELRKRGIDPRTWKKERKEARLLFQAEIPEHDGCPAIKLTCKSKVFQCSSTGPPGNPEIWWASISEGSVEGGDELGLIGKKFQSGFKVRFFSANPSELTLC